MNENEKVNAKLLYQCYTCTGSVINILQTWYRLIKSSYLSQFCEKISCAKIVLVCVLDHIIHFIYVPGLTQTASRII